MEEFAPTFWHWWILAAALIAFEVVLPTFYLLWTGIAAFVVGLALWLAPSLAWEIQVVIFAILSVLSIVMWRNYAKKNPAVSDEPLLNRRGEQYVGRVVTLKEPIVDGIGKVQIDDSTWKIIGNDYAVGTKIKLIAVDNVVFQVEKVN